MCFSSEKLECCVDNLNFISTDSFDCVDMSEKRKFHQAFGKREVVFDKGRFEGHKVEVPESPEDLEATLEKLKGRLVVVGVMKENVVVCYQLRKIFYEMSSRFGEMSFLEVDSDKAEWVAIGKKYNVTAVPSVIFFRNNKVLTKIEGAYPQKLKDMLCQLSEEKDAAILIAEEGEIPKGLEDLRFYVDQGTTECLNVENEPDYFDFLDRKEKKLVSDCDEQVILGIGFNQNVMVDSIRIKAPASSGPNSLKIFVNLQSFDFSDAGEFQCSQEIKLSAEQLKGEELVPLNRTKFSSVKNLHLFVPGNQGGEDVTEIESLALYGSPLKPSLGVGGYNMTLTDVTEAS